MRFVVFREPNTDPTIPARWMDVPMALLEDGVCSRQEEIDRVLFGMLICAVEWDK